MFSCIRGHGEPENFFLQSAWNSSVRSNDCQGSHYQSGSASKRGAKYLEFASMIWPPKKRTNFLMATAATTGNSARKFHCGRASRRVTAPTELTELYGTFSKTLAPVRGILLPTIYNASAITSNATVQLDHKSRII
jgi:hypothetical protein